MLAREHEFAVLQRNLGVLAFASDCAASVRSWTVEEAIEGAAVTGADPSVPPWLVGQSQHLQALTLALTARAWSEANGHLPARDAFDAKLADDISTFRADVLGKRFPLLPEQVLPWARSLPDCVDHTDSRCRGVISLPKRDGYAELCSFQAGGALERLSRFSSALSDSFRWKVESHCIAFVVSDSIPIVSAIDVQSSEELVTLTVHRGASPEEVAWMYAAARGWRAPSVPLRRARTVSVNALRAFSFSYLLRPRHEWPERWGQWNGRYPQEAYGSSRTFRQAAMRARRSLLGR